MATNFDDIHGARFRVCDFPSEPKRILPPIQGFEDQPLVSLEEAVQPLTSIVPQLDHMVWTVKQNCQQPKEGLSKDESASIGLYTLEWFPEEKTVYYILNATLRSQSRRQLIPWFLYLRLLIFALSKLPSTVPRIIYRGIKEDLREEYPVGKTCIWWFFTSCTLTLDVLQNYLGKVGKRTIFNIICNEAKTIKQHSSYASEDECLLYPGRQFQVTSSFDAGNDLHIVQLEETQPPFPLLPIDKASSDIATNIVSLSTALSTMRFSPRLHTTTKSPVPTTTRTAIDYSGRIGYLYDGYRDQIIHQAQLSLPEVSNTTRNMRRCEIIHGDNMPYKNLLKTILIDDQSRLSLLLNLAEKDGITKIIDYDIPINKYNRIFRCTYVQRTQKLADEATNDLKLTTQSAATHFIIGVEWGIDVAVVLQLPHNDENIQIIDRVLKNICNLLLDDGNTLSSRSDELHALKMIMDTKVYSNVNEIARVTSLLDVCTYIQKRKDNCITQPILYTLRPYISLYPHSVAKDITFVPLTEPYNNNLEEYILQITTDVKRLRKTVKEDLPKLLHDDLREQSLDARKLLSIVEGKYNEEMPRYSKLVLQIRRNQLPATFIEKELEDNRSILMKSAIQNLDHLIDELKEKEHFIHQLKEKDIRYLNVVEFHIDPTDNESTIERSITRDIRYDRILCSNDKLNKIDPDRFRQFRDELIKQRKTNPQLRLIYADFSYCTHNLQYMMRLPLDIYNNENTILKKQSARLYKETVI